MCPFAAHFPFSMKDELVTQYRNVSTEGAAGFPHSESYQCVQKTLQGYSCVPWLEGTGVTSALLAVLTELCAVWSRKNVCSLFTWECFYFFSPHIGKQRKFRSWYWLVHLVVGFNHIMLLNCDK